MKYTQENISLLARILGLNCVRNTYLEQLHMGTFPSSKTGDFSDVKVVTPYGEIPWNEVGRLSDVEMENLMKEVVNKLYSFFYYQGNERLIEALIHLFPTEWDEPQLDPDFVYLCEREPIK